MATKPTAKNLRRAFIDTDIIIRLLTGDDPKKKQQAIKLFKKVAAETLELHAGETVIADAVYVLSSKKLYSLSRENIRDLLSALLQYSNFKLDNKNTIIDALDIYASTNLDFGDALLVVLTQQSKEKIIYSYDHDFDKFPKIIRQEP